VKAADYIEQALTLAREDFVSMYPFYFLLGESRLEPAAARPIDGFEGETRTGADLTSQLAEPKSSHRLLLAVRKVQETFPSMITVGRTRNNDIVIPDVRVSRFHALFRLFDDRIELSDAGSHCGTWIGTRKLPPKGLAQIVIAGERVRFGPQEFILLDAGTCWDRVHNPAR
jgi:ABC transport system ATP-binding/permease protein